MMFLELPWQWWAIVVPVPAAMLVARIVTWALMLNLRRRDPRPGYINLTKRP